MQQEQKQDIQILQPFLKELPEGITVRHIKRLEASSRTAEVKSTRVFQSNKRLGPSEFQIYEQLRAKISELGDDIQYDNKDSIKNLIQSLTPKYYIGNQFQKVEEIEKINFRENEAFTQEYSSFTTENGIVYLLIVWATWCGTCQDLMDKNQKMLENNLNWKGKVKIIGFSVDDETQDVVKLVNQKQLKQVEHYRFIKGWTEEIKLLKLLQLRNFPFVLLLNKWGKIVFMDYPQQENLEQKINSEINAEKDNTEVQQEITNNQDQINELLSKQEYKQFKANIFSMQTALKAFDDRVTVSIEKINVWKPDGTKEVLKRSKLELTFDVSFSEEEKLNQFLENHWNTVPENLRYVKEAKIGEKEKQQQKLLAKFQEAFSALGVKISYNSNFYFPNTPVQTIINLLMTLRAKSLGHLVVGTSKVRLKI